VYLGSVLLSRGWNTEQPLPNCENIYRLCYIWWAQNHSIFKNLRH